MRRGATGGASAQGRGALREQLTYRTEVPRTASMEEEECKPFIE